VVGVGATVISGAATGAQGLAIFQQEYGYDIFKESGIKKNPMNMCVQMKELGVNTYNPGCGF
jgi:hypothetical protein